MRKIPTILAALALLALPGVAIGQGGGNAGSDEYSENVPGGGGNQPSNNNPGGGSSGGSSSGSGSSGGSLPSGTQDDLLEQGSDGAAARDFAQSSGPDGSGGDKGKNSTGSGAGSGDNGSAGSATDSSAGSTAADSSGSDVGSVVGEVAGGSDDGMGILLPIILGTAVLAAIAFAILRRRSTPGSA